MDNDTPQVTNSTLLVLSVDRCMYQESAWPCQALVHLLYAGNIGLCVSLQNGLEVEVKQKQVISWLEAGVYVWVESIFVVNVLGASKPCVRIGATPLAQSYAPVYQDRMSQEEFSALSKVGVRLNSNGRKPFFFDSIRGIGSNLFKKGAKDAD